MAAPIIEVRDLTKTFGDKTVVDRLDMTIEEGQLYGFLGPNGSGKTTAIRMMCGLVPLTSGTGTCLGFDIGKQAHKIKPLLGYMTQHFSLYRDLTVREMFIEQKKHRSTDDLLQGIVLKENTAPLDAAANTADGVLFKYWISHSIETSFIFTRKLTPRIPTGVTIRAATSADLAAMQAFFDREAPRRNGYPVYDMQKMAAGDPYYAGLKVEDYALALRDGQIIGMLAGWNQKAYKQTRIVGFKPIIKLLRPLYNLYVGLAGGFKLPAVGGALNYLSLYNILIARDDKAVFQALIDWVMAHQGQKYDALAVGITHGDPLEEVPRGYKRQKLFSSHFWLSYGEDPRPGIDKRPLYVELGRL